MDNGAGLPESGWSGTKSLQLNESVPTGKKDRADNLNAHLSKLVTMWCRDYWGQRNMLPDTTRMLLAKFPV